MKVLLYSLGITIILIVINVFNVPSKPKENSPMDMDILDVTQIKLQEGILSCNIFENEKIGLNPTLFYSIEIPILPFNSGHSYADQPTETEIRIDMIQFKEEGQSQEKNWRNLVGKTYKLTYEDKTSEGSVYLGTEHCPLNSSITFLKLEGNKFEVEINMFIEFNINTKNLPENEILKFNTTLIFDGLHLYDETFLPSLKEEKDTFAFIERFINLEGYKNALEKYDSPHVNWKQLKAK